jgi:multiple sugar transport system substrate-binding protein
MRLHRSAAALAAAALVLAACGGGSGDTAASGGGDAASGSSDRALVKMVLWPGPEGDAMQQVVDAYNAAQGIEDGIEVEMILLSRDNTFAQQATEISAESSNVDIYFVASYNVGQFQSGLDPLTGIDIDPSLYFPAALEGLQIGGEQYALPLDLSNHFLYYRTDLVERLLTDDAWKTAYRAIAADVLGAARDPKPAEEWDTDDYLVAAAFFTQKVNPESPTTYGTALQLLTSPFNTVIWNDLLWGVGGNWVDAQGEPNLESDEARRAVNIYRTIYTEGWTYPDAASAEYGETNAALQNEQAAFAIQWSAAYAELTDPERSPAIADNIGVAPVPGSPQSTHVHALAIALNTHSQQKEAALRWMEYLATAEAMDAYAKAGAIPSMPSVLAANVDINPVFAFIADHVQKYGYSPTIWEGTFAAMTALSEELTPAFIGTGDVDAALAAANARLAELLKG